MSRDLNGVGLLTKTGLFPKGVLTMSTSVKPLYKLELVLMSGDLYRIGFLPKIGLFPQRILTMPTSIK